MNSVELFTGVGGLALGTHQAGFNHRGLVEWDEDACTTLRKNASADAVPGIHHWRIHPADVRMFSFKEFGRGCIDLVAGGAPCQPFSLGGKHLAQDDARNMIPEFVRAVRELQPRAFILENVKGLLRQSFRAYFNYIELQLKFPTQTKLRDESWMAHLGRLENTNAQSKYKGLRYNVTYQLLNAADYGIPQARERVFVVGFRSDIDPTWSFPKATHSFAALMHEQWTTEQYWKERDLPRPKEPPRYATRWSRGLNAEPPSEKPWNTIRDAFRGLPDPRDVHEAVKFSNHRFIPGARSYPGHTGSHPDLPAKTLKAGVHGVPGGENMLATNNTVRYFTVREAARIQTFPDTWHFEGAWSETMRQLGNAVPVDLAGVVARGVAEKLGQAAIQPKHHKRTSNKNQNEATDE